MSHLLRSVTVMYENSYLLKHFIVKSMEIQVPINCYMNIYNVNAPQAVHRTFANLFMLCSLVLDYDVPILVCFCAIFVE